jgi:uncharacterized protein YktB (UPF0637 family)
MRRDAIPELLPHSFYMSTNHAKPEQHTVQGLLERENKSGD